jgi:oligopeptide/dipeptide ABC transporter ATP-binding protein
MSYNKFIMTMLEVKNLNIAFASDDEVLSVVKNVSFSLSKGKLLGIVGESGCGKSVTLMSVLRLLPKNALVNAEYINFNGQNLLNLTEEKLQTVRGNKIALIPQDPLTSLNPLYTVGDQIMEVIMLHQKVDKKHARALAIEALRQVNIPEPDRRIDEYPHQFSGGMCQRVIIAMALSCHPDLIIADEPTTALDVTVQAQIMKLFKEIQQKMGTSIILVTHDLALISEVADEVIVMYSGEIAEQASANVFFSNPKHPYSKGLLASLPKADEERLCVIEGQPPSIRDKISGCKFHPRCPFAFDRCKVEAPVLEFSDGGHGVSCWLYVKR